MRKNWANNSTLCIVRTYFCCARIFGLNFFFFNFCLVMYSTFKRYLVPPLELQIRSSSTNKYAFTVFNFKLAVMMLRRWHRHCHWHYLQVPQIRSSYHGTRFRSFFLILEGRVKVRIDVVGGGFGFGVDVFHSALGWLSALDFDSALLSHGEGGWGWWREWW